jgi:hypothetical protein
MGILLFLLFFLFMNTKSENEKKHGELFAQIKDIKTSLSVQEHAYIPDSIYFFGGNIPLHIYGVWDDIDEWIKFFTNAKNRWRVVSYIEAKKEYFLLLDSVFVSERISTDMKYLGIAESELNPNAVSAQRAVGWWQFIKSTALRNGLRINKDIDERRELCAATKAACNEIKTLFSEFRKTFTETESWWFALAAYNAGLGRIQKAIKTDKENSYFTLVSIPRETERYIPCIIALKLILENPERYGFFSGMTYGGPKMILVEKSFSKFTSWKTFLAELQKAGFHISLKELIRANTHVKNKNGIPKGNFIFRIPDRR